MRRTGQPQPARFDGAGVATATAPAPPATPEARVEQAKVVAAPAPEYLGVFGRLMYDRRKKKNPGLLEIAEVATEFSNSLRAGLSPAESLQMSAKNFRMRKPKFAAALSQIEDRLASGYSIESTLPPYQDMLGEFFVHMAIVGEKSGSLEDKLLVIAKNYRQQYKNKSIVLSALVQPAAVLTVGAGVIWIILTVTVPKFKDLYEALASDGTLPLPTRILMWIGDFLSSWTGYAFLGALGFGAAALTRGFRKNPRMRAWLHRNVLKVPIIGDLILYNSIAQASHTLADGIDSMNDVPKAVEMAARTCGNLTVKSWYDAAAMMQRDTGKTLADCIEAIGKGTKPDGSGVFPDKVVNVMRSGEKNGALDSALVILAEEYDQKVATLRDNALTLINPILLVFIGGIVLGIMLAMYGPLFMLISKLSNR